MTSLAAESHEDAQLSRTDGFLLHTDHRQLLAAISDCVHWLILDDTYCIPPR